VTESEWEACADPTAMLGHLGRRPGARKPRLFTAACCRRVWGLLTTSTSRRAVEAAEGYADGTVTEGELAAAAQAAGAAARPGSSRASAWDAYLGLRPAGCLALAARAVAATDRLLMPAWAARLIRGADRGERSAQADLVRCIFGNPFRPLTVAPSWRTPAVVALARGAYDERELPSGHLDAAHLLVLADALEEAGATDAGLLAHLRSPGPHVRGCAGLDALLGLQ
jgi:hypothetical protein